MNRLSRQLVASSRLIRSSNVSAVKTSTTVYSRKYAKKHTSSRQDSATHPHPATSSEIRTAKSESHTPPFDTQSSTKEVSVSSSPTIQVNNLDELLEVFESQAGQEMLLMLPERAFQELNELLSKVMQSDGKGDAHIMHAVVQLLSAFNFKLQVTVPLPEEVEQQRAEDGEVVPESDENTETEEVIKRPYPNLMSSDPLMDSREVLDLKPTATNPFHNRVIVRNHRSIFHEAMANDGFNFDDPNWTPAKSDLADEELQIDEVAGLEGYPVEELMKFVLVRRFVVQQTGKGKIDHHQCFTVVGDGNGMVGLGMGTDIEPTHALTKSHIAAIKNMDHVDRFENRTIWTEMSGKFRSTQIKMRPRPMGFGLRCQPVLHQVLKAAGIKDISAKIWGSRNPIMIMQAALQMLQGGHNPLGFGNGIGGKGKRLTKGIGMRSKFHIERERGRRLHDFRK
ncbi:37S ribosomal protein S5 [Lentinula guzmanii]|uniref:Small ribosomal subunit protein uS5m n=1 Tax=Lentinula guzmanii TaxID=2804957 RepID=A0AA38MSM2_9AGAR|nr:37S ribosomal protein S5 [Lentinula guzmanii]